MPDFDMTFWSHWHIEVVNEKNKPFKCDQILPTSYTMWMYDTLTILNVVIRCKECKGNNLR